MNVTKFTRAPREGKMIICPHCNYKHFVYHFSWSTLNCIHCDSTVNKLDWRL